jgi:HD-GYP domain-containing protein (c-di-GMP phosphodiesterase class II)
MTLHTKDTEDIIEPLRNETVISMAASHHETHDGKGYHRRKTIKELEPNQDVVNVADIMSALLAKREYKDALSYDDSILIIKKEIENNKKAKIELYDLLKNNKEIIMQSFNDSNLEYDRIKAELKK